MKQIKIIIEMALPDKTTATQREAIDKRIQELANFTYNQFMGLIDKDSSIQFNTEDKNSYKVGKEWIKNLKISAWS